MEKHKNSWVYMVLDERIKYDIPICTYEWKEYTYINVIFVENISMYAFYGVYFNKTFEFYTWKL